MEPIAQAIESRGISDLAAQIGRQARSAREESGLSIRAAAAKVRCSPRFVLQLEQGKATVRMDKVLQMLAGVGLQMSIHKRNEPAMASPGWKERIEARGKQRLYEEKLARAHERIAASLALGEIDAGAIGQAKDQVKKWSDQRICSQWYVDQWSKILEGSGAQIASKLLKLDKGDAKALYQNTPFGFLVKEQLSA